MKRLNYYLLNMQNDTATYTEMYEGTVTVFPSNYPQQLDYPDRYTDYYLDDIILSIERTNKLAQDKPTLVWSIPVERLGIEDCCPAAADHCLRSLAPYIDALNAELYNRSRPDSENGKYYLYRPGGEVLVRNTCFFALRPQKDYDNGPGATVYIRNIDAPLPPKLCLCVRMQVQLPKRKLKKARMMLCHDLPEAILAFIDGFDISGLWQAAELAEKQRRIREYLKDGPYAAFIANGSILPRSKGTDLPMENAVPFTSAPADEIEICGVRGMGIKRGVTVITGGGYSGKSTLLDAISAGIYDHRPGDGRELCITDDSAVTISAEDGRSVKNVNISPFIKWIPGGDPARFSTDRASGSTSQAANIAEAVDFGAKLILIDEDRSATNFMIRDGMMKELIKKEPITPFTDRAAELYASLGVSTILVIGGSGEYLSVADRVYLMDDFVISDATAAAKAICKQSGADRNTDALRETARADWRQDRTLTAAGFTSYPDGMKSERLFVSDMGFIAIGDESVDLRGLHDIVTKRQLDALGYMLRRLEIENTDGKIDVKKKIDALYERIESEGLDTVFSAFFTGTERFLDLPRKAELNAVINRMRRVSFV